MKVSGEPLASLLKGRLLWETVIRDARWLECLPQHMTILRPCPSLLHTLAHTLMKVGPSFTSSSRSHTASS